MTAMEWIPVAFYVLCVCWCVWFYSGVEEDAQ